MKNVKSKIVAVSSIWLINLLMIGIVIVLIIKSSAIIKMYQPIEPINNLEGVSTWSTHVSLEAFGYKLNRELTYSSERDEPFQSALTFTPPFELVAPHNPNSNSELSIRPITNSVITARAEVHQAVPVEYVITDSSTQFWLTTLYLIAYTLSLLVMFWWFWILRKLVKNIANQKFFIAENARRFIFLAIPPLLISFLDLFSRLYFEGFFIKNFQVMNGGLFKIIDFEIIPIVFGLIFLIIGGIVKEGIKIKEEQDLTI